MRFHPVFLITNVSKNLRSSSLCVVTFVCGKLRKIIDIFACPWMSFMYIIDGFCIDFMCEISCVPDVLWSYQIIVKVCVVS